jgi:Protein of unknown function (DUF3306)
MLSRWSRLKSAASKTELAVVPPPSEPPRHSGPSDSVAGGELVKPALTENPLVQDPVKVELPKIADLTPDSDFTPFMQSGVDAVDRNAALKKLFTDPHYNQMDGLDIYIDDYGKPDPIPEEMLKRLMASKFLGLFEEEAPNEVAEKAELDNLDVVESQTLELTENPRENPSSSLSGDIPSKDAPKERDFLEK